MTGLKASISELMAHRKEQEAKAAGAEAADIELSRQSGVDSRDIMYLRQLTRGRGLLIVIRCPKRVARAFHGTFAPKTFATKTKSGESGLVIGKSGTIMVSDYDMMCVWRHTGTGFQKIYISALEPGAATGAWGAEARELVKEMNQNLVSKVQHGCQDDFHSLKNPGVKPADHFLAIRMGQGTYLSDPIHCEAFYRQNALPWPYAADGRYNGPTAGGGV